MQGAFAHCAELVRIADRDRFVTALFVPARRRDALNALHAFNCEVSRVREVAHSPLPGEIRLQWWSEVVSGERQEEATANPVAAALLATMAAHKLSPQMLAELIEARRFDLYDDPMATLADLEAYATKTSSTPISLAAQILAGVDAKVVAGPAGIAYAIAGLLRALPLHARRGQLYVPMELLDRHGVRSHDVFAGRATPGLAAALAELRNLARRHLALAHERLPALPPEALPALLPLAVVRYWLGRLERSGPFAPADIPAWRRQWLIWRAARNPRRIAG